MIKKEYKYINGLKQCLVTFSSSCDNPVVLYLHGGPGDACSSLIEAFNSTVMEAITLVVWEQRGSGLSYVKFTDSNSPKIQDYIDDVKQIVEGLIEEYGVEKIHLIGHSWGSVIGVKSMLQFPEHIASYTGVGQVVQMQKTYEHQIEFINSHNGDIRDRNQSVLNFESKTWMSDVLAAAQGVVKHGGSLYLKSNQNSLVFPFLRTKLYSITSLINRQKGSKQSIERLWPELMSVDFTEITSFEVPIYLIEGRHDHHVSIDIALKWYQNLTTQKQIYIFEKSGHFPQWEEPDDFNELLIRLFRKG